MFLSKKGCYNLFSSLSDNYAGAFKENWCVLSVSAGVFYYFFPDVSVLNAFFVICKNGVISMKYRIQDKSCRLLYYSSGGKSLPEGVIPGFLFMILPGRKPVSAIPGMMLFVCT